MTEVQVSSYYKMRSHFFVPRPSIEETTRPNWLKFCMQPPLGITRGIIEGFFDIWSGGPDMGYPWDPRRGPKILKNFFSIFLLFLTEIVDRRSNSLVKVKINPPIDHFLCFTCLRIERVGGWLVDYMSLKPSKALKMTIRRIIYHFYE